MFGERFFELRFGAGGETRTLMRSEPRQILSLVRIPISPLRQFAAKLSGHIRGSWCARQPGDILQWFEWGSPKPPKRANKTGLLALSKSVLPNAKPCYTMTKPVQNWQAQAVRPPADLTP